jgi:hypothetical protein
MGIGPEGDERGGESALVIALADRKSSEKEAATKVLRADEDRILAVIDVVVEVLTRTKTSSMVCECRSWHTGHAEVDDM